MMSTPLLMKGPLVLQTLAGIKTQTRWVVNPQPAFEGVESFGDSWKWQRGADNFSGVTTEQLTGAAGLLHPSRCPYGTVGDRLIVRETWTAHWGHAKGAIPSMILFGGEQIKQRDGTFAETSPNNPLCIYHRASFGDKPPLSHLAWKPSIHMPRWASRLTLTLSGVRVERLQDITAEDALAEGIEGRWHPDQKDLWTWKDYNRSARFGEPFYHYGSAVTARSTFAALWNSINEKRGFGWDVNPWVWVLSWPAYVAPALPQNAA